MAKLFVICGHGAGDPGATGNGYTEAERVRALGKRIKELGGSSVTLGDVNRNYYADKGISSLTISKDYQIIELHMDSAAASARGGHVIIKSGFEPDAYDNALANMLKEILPGRSQMIVKRSDLANPKRAAAKGYGYRLVEFGFISNATDVQIFNSRMDDLAKGVLNAFGVKASGSNSNTSSSGSGSSGSSSSSKKSVSEIAKEVIAGKWGNGDDRKKKLEAAGYNYNEIQSAVNNKLNGSSTTTSSKKSVSQIAKEVIAGKWGNGETRKKKLEAAGYNYNTVQAEVNKQLGSGSSSKKRVDTIAKEVIAGKWGNGNDRKKKLEAAGYDYNTIQKRVNQMLK